MKPDPHPNRYRRSPSPGKSYQKNDTSRKEGLRVLLTPPGSDKSEVLIEAKAVPPVRQQGPRLGNLPEPRHLPGRAEKKEPTQPRRIKLADLTAAFQATDSAAAEAAAAGTVRTPPRQPKTDDAHSHRERGAAGGGRNNGSLLDLRGRGDAHDDLAGAHGNNGRPAGMAADEDDTPLPPPLDSEDLDAEDLDVPLPPPQASELEAADPHLAELAMLQGTKVLQFTESLAGLATELERAEVTLPNPTTWSPAQKKDVEVRAAARLESQNLEVFNGLNALAKPTKGIDQRSVLDVHTDSATGRVKLTHPRWLVDRIRDLAVKIETCEGLPVPEPESPEAARKSWGHSPRVNQEGMHRQIQARAKMAVSARTTIVAFARGTFANELKALLASDEFDATQLEGEDRTTLQTAMNKLGIDPGDDDRLKIEAKLKSAEVAFRTAVKSSPQWIEASARQVEPTPDNEDPASDGPERRLLPEFENVSDEQAAPFAEPPSAEALLEAFQSLDQNSEDMLTHKQGKFAREVIGVAQRYQNYVADCKAQGLQVHENVATSASGLSEKLQQQLDRINFDQLHDEALAEFGPALEALNVSGGRERADAAIERHKQMNAQFASPNLMDVSDVSAAPASLMTAPSVSTQRASALHELAEKIENLKALDSEFRQARRAYASDEHRPTANREVATAIIDTVSAHKAVIDLAEEPGANFGIRETSNLRMVVERLINDAELEVAQLDDQQLHQLGSAFETLGMPQTSVTTEIQRRQGFRHHTRDLNDAIHAIASTKGPDLLGALKSLANAATAEVDKERAAQTVMDEMSPENFTLFAAAMDDPVMRNLEAALPAMPPPADSARGEQMRGATAQLKVLRQALNASLLKREDSAQRPVADLVSPADVRPDVATAVRLAFHPKPIRPAPVVKTERPATQRPGLFARLARFVSAFPDRAERAMAVRVNRQIATHLNVLSHPYATMNAAVLALDALHNLMDQSSKRNQATALEMLQRHVARMSPVGLLALEVNLRSADALQPEQLAKLREKQITRARQDPRNFATPLDKRVTGAIAAAILKELEEKLDDAKIKQVFEGLPTERLDLALAAVAGASEPGVQRVMQLAKQVLDARNDEFGASLRAIQQPQFDPNGDIRDPEQLLRNVIAAVGQLKTMHASHPHVGRAPGVLQKAIAQALAADQFPYGKVHDEELLRSLESALKSQSLGFENKDITDAIRWRREEIHGLEMLRGSDALAKSPWMPSDKDPINAKLGTAASSPVLRRKTQAMLTPLAKGEAPRSLEDMLMAANALIWPEGNGGLRDKPRELAVVGQTLAKLGAGDLGKLLKTLRMDEVREIASQFPEGIKSELVVDGRLMGDIQTVGRIARVIASGTDLVEVLNAASRAGSARPVPGQTAAYAQLVITATPHLAVFEDALRRIESAPGIADEFRPAADAFREKVTAAFAGEFAFNELTDSQLEQLPAALAALGIDDVRPKFAAEKARRIETLRSQSIASAQAAFTALAAAKDPNPVVALAELGTAARLADRVHALQNPGSARGRAGAREELLRFAAKEWVFPQLGAAQGVKANPDTALSMIRAMEFAVAKAGKEERGAVATEMLDRAKDLRVMLLAADIPVPESDWAAMPAMSPPLRFALFNSFGVDVSQSGMVRQKRGSAPEPLQAAMAQNLARIRDDLRNRPKPRQLSTQMVFQLQRAGVEWPQGSLVDGKLPEEQRLPKGVENLKAWTRNNPGLVQTLVALTNGQAMEPLEREEGWVTLADGTRGKLAGTPSTRYEVEPDGNGGLLVKCSFSIRDAKRLISAVGPDGEALPNDIELDGGSSTSQFTVSISAAGELGTPGRVTTTYNAGAWDFVPPDTLASLLSADRDSPERSALRATVDKYFQPEGLDFHEALETFDRYPTFDQLTTLADRFIKAGAQDQANISAQLRNQISNAVSQEDGEVFFNALQKFEAEPTQEKAEYLVAFINDGVRKATEGVRMELHYAAGLQDRIEAAVTSPQARSNLTRDALSQVFLPAKNENMLLMNTNDWQRFVKEVAAREQRN